MEIAIIAHDGKKAEMVQFLNEQAETLDKFIVQLAYTLGCFILPKYMIKSFTDNGKKFPPEFDSISFNYKKE